MIRSARFLTALLAIIIVSGCATFGTSGGEGRWARVTLRKLTLRQKIGQMMVHHMNMHFLNNETAQWHELEKLLTTDGIGGVHVWYGDAGTSLTMMNQMQKLSNLPILFDADIERGLGQRYPAGSHLPPLMAIAATNNPANAYEAGRITALEGQAAGIHFNLGPVVDVNNNPANP
ncbi:MAG: hypothetical protein KAU50_06300, partial [Candidatus Marinimicrobia bacterium]|nr:hypothetical protein [Candidatus Neomarinimicrobiota bacterium]